MHVLVHIYKQACTFSLISLGGDIWNVDPMSGNLDIDVNDNSTLKLDYSID